MGITSEGEYFDGEFDEITTSEEMIDALNAVSVPEIVVTDIVLIPDNAKTAMAVVSASDYKVNIKSPDEQKIILQAAKDFLNQQEIVVMKKTKKSEKEEDIKPYILDFKLQEDGIYMLLKTGSIYNLKPELVMEALYGFAGCEYDFLKVSIHRLETYMDSDAGIVPLSKAGERF
jgi:radical SAM-linked protein